MASGSAVAAVAGAVGFAGAVDGAGGVRGAAGFDGTRREVPAWTRGVGFGPAGASGFEVSGAGWAAGEAAEESELRVDAAVPVAASGCT